MAHNVLERVVESTKTAEVLYHRLVLLVGKSGSGKSIVLRKVVDVLGASVVNISLSLSCELLELTRKQRLVQLSIVLSRVLGETNSPVVLDNLEILFSSGLQQDPLRLLQAISRHRLVLASWSGSVNSEGLFYAKTGHPEFRRYEASGALIVRMDDETTI